MEFYAVKLTLHLLNGPNKEADVMVADIYKADRQEYDETYQLLLFKNDKEHYYGLPIDYRNNTVVSDGILCNKNEDSTFMAYVATSKDTPNKALSKIQAQILKEYGSTNPIAQAIPNTLRNMRQPLSAIMRDEDTAEIIATAYFSQGNKFVWAIRGYNELIFNTKDDNP